MVLKNFQLIQYNDMLMSYADKKLPQKISYAITKNLMIISSELEIYSKMLNKIVDSFDEYLIKDEDGNSKYYPSGLPLVDEEHEKDYTSQVEELLNQEIKVQFYHIDEDAFIYENSDRYDILSAVDIMKLSEILCATEESEK